MPTLAEILKTVKVIPLFSDPDPAVTCYVIDACVEAATKAGHGTIAFEYTLRTAGWALQDGGLTTVAKHVATNHKDKVYFGVGSCIVPGAVDTAVNLGGARYVVSPYTNPEIIGRCRVRQVECMPAGSTAHELIAAYVALIGQRVSAPIVKLFPSRSGPKLIQETVATLGGRDFQGDGHPSPPMLVVATGLSDDDVSDPRQWFAEQHEGGGLLAIGASGAIIKKKNVAACNWAAIRDDLERLFDKVRSL